MGIGSVLLLLALLAPAVEAAEPAEPKRVLLLYSFGRDFAPFNAVAPPFRTELARQLKQPVAFYEASLDTERIGPPGDERALVDFLRSHHGTAQPDLVVTLGASALRFYLRHRERLFPDAPLLVTGIAERRLQGIQLGSRDRVVSLHSDIRDIADDILKMLPETGTLAVIQGSSRVDRLERVEFESRLAPLASRVKLIWLHDLTMAQLRERVAALPPDSAIVYGHFAVDAAGVPYENERALAAVLEVANAPVFGTYDSQLGAGIVGGPLVELRKMGEVSGQIAQRMLEDRAKADAAIRVLEAGTPVYDWRELRRWRIPESRLPDGAEVRFRPPSLWEEHRTLILLSITIVLFQTALITALLFQRVRRRRAEKEALSLGGRLIEAQDAERARLARDLHDDVSQQLAGLSIALSGLKQQMSGPDVAEELQADLLALHERTAALAQNVRHLSHDLHPTVLRHVGLVAVLTAYCAEVERAHGMPSSCSAEGDFTSIAPEVALCLYRIAQEALRNVIAHASASRADIRLLRTGDHAELTITDNGSGFDVASSLGRGNGLGLVSIVERVKLAGGAVSITAELTKGSCVHVRIPANALVRDADAGTEDERREYNLA